ncbi:MAG: adenylate/guanylate cyclase domain-containing protein [Gaiellaceae bacterium]
MAAQPTGTVTMLFTDIEGSTTLLQRLGAERYVESLELHRRLLREAFDRHCGYEVDCEGDAFFVAFARATDAVAAASEAQQALLHAEWPEKLPIRVRMGIHTGEPLAAPPKYVGLDVHKAARIMAAGHGGQVLVSATTGRLLDGHVRLADLGEHRLKDLSQPETLFQLLVPGSRVDFPALKTLGNRPTNLPVVATHFIGRETELATVQDLVRADRLRVVTLTGTGGIGKTRLALQTAAELSDEFSDGVYWVPFASLRDPDLIVDTIAQTLGLRETTDEAIAETLLRYVSDKQLLLVLDNLEHLLAGVRVWLAALIAAAPKLHVLATSREALRLAAEQLYEVPPLPVPAFDNDAVTDNSAVALFVGRAQAVNPDFALCAQNAAHIAEIVRRLEGLPLAIELAAARVRTLSPEALSQRLDQRLRLLTTGVHDVEERQRTLRATIQWSYDLLTEGEQRLFARLSVFVGGCRLEAVDSVCNPEGELEFETVDGVSSLIDKSLLRRRDDPDGQPRYWMLESLREYAHAALSEDPMANHVRERHATEVADVVGTLDRKLRSAGAPGAIAHLVAEQPNIRAALAYTEEQRLDELFVRIVGAAAYFWYLRGVIREGEMYARRAARITEGRKDATRAIALNALGSFTWHLGKLELAETLAAEAAELAETAADPALLLWTIHLRAVVAASLSRPEATVLYERAAALGRAAGDSWFEMMALLNLGDLGFQEGRLEEALQLTAKGVDAAKAVGDDAIVASGLANRGSILLALGRADDAARDLLKAADVGESHGYREPVAWASRTLAVASQRRGFVEDAAFLIGYTDRILADHGYSLRGREADEFTAACGEVRRQLAPEIYEKRAAAGDAAARQHIDLTEHRLMLLSGSS